MYILKLYPERMNAASTNFRSPRSFVFRQVFLVAFVLLFCPARLVLGSRHQMNDSMPLLHDHSTEYEACY
jgi:hypothetical protein